ncbi:MAG: alpha/beta fold hydrolase [Acidimicrobiia bacterium]|nr:alpha/beta fold hydrolase [Acidimicrobiia bacterium]
MTTVVAIHGNGGGGFRFSRMRDHVPDDVRLEAITLPGFGGRAADPTLLTVTDYAEHLWHEIRDLPRPIVLLGHGIGGTIALDLLQRHEVAGLILHAPVGTRLDSRWFPRLMKPTAVRRLVRWGISSRLSRPLLRRRFFGGKVPDEYANRFLAEYGRAQSFGQMFDIINSTWWDSLAPTPTPTVLLWGMDDRVLGADQVEDYRRLLPDNRVDVVPGWGHFPMATDPAAYTARVVEWANSLVRHSERFLTLGSGTAAADGIAPKAAHLDRAKRAGLRVPEGIIVPDGEDAVEVPSWLGESLAVRSAFGSEDGTAQSHAGYYATVLRVSPDEVGTAVDKVRASADATIRRDILIMEMVDAVTSGVAFSEPGYADDLIESTTGTAERLVAGEERPAASQLARLLPGEKPTDEGWRGRLALLLRDIRAEFGDNGWDVEWADDGHECSLIQIRPTTAPTRRDDWFTMANHREILPDPPSVFMTSVLAEGSGELLDYYRRFDPSLTKERLFIEVFDHRPMINLSLMTDFMRSLGLPTRLVTDSIGGGAVVDRGLDPMRAIRRLPALLRLARAQLGSSRYAERMLSDMRWMTAANSTTLEEAVGRARRAFVATVHGMTALNTAAAAPTALLKASGTLEAHGARQETAATAMFRELDPLRKKLTAEDRERLDDGLLPRSATFRRSWNDWLRRYGHRGAYESDLSRPRYSEAPGPIFAALTAGRAIRRSGPRWDLRQIMTLPLWLLAKVPMARREEFRSEAMRIFQRIRNDLLRLSAERGLADDDLWLLTAEEVRRLDRGWIPPPSLLERRRQELAAARTRQVPNLISRFSSQLNKDPAGDAIGLVAGQLEGRAWVLSEPATDIPPALTDEPLVLVAPSVDAGWLPTFTLVAGVAVEMGGNLSHGSIILRELGLPAVTNAAGLTERIRSGDRVRLDGNTGVVELLD